MRIVIQTNLFNFEVFKGKYGAVIFLCQVLYKFRNKKDEDIRVYPEEIAEDLAMNKNYAYRVMKLLMQEDIIAKGKRKNSYVLTENGKKFLQDYKYPEGGK